MGLQFARPGDYSENGLVAAADYVVSRKGLGTLSNQNHYDVWRAHFGQTTGASLRQPAVGGRIRAGYLDTDESGRGRLVSSPAPRRIKGPSNSSTRDTRQQSTV